MKKITIYIAIVISLILVSFAVRKMFSNSEARICTSFDGIWLEDFNQCENINEFQCLGMGGIYHGDCEGQCVSSCQL